MDDHRVKPEPCDTKAAAPSTTEPTHRIAIVGAGPAGFFAADALLKWRPAVAVDILNDLPAPFGLVRDGVAPDHQAIKSVGRRFEKLLEHPSVRYFGNVELGRDISVGDLRAHYDQIVYAFGAQSERRLGVAGEELAGVHAALTFVGWYNGHPRHRDQSFDLGCRHVVVVGNGNVALDIARILAVPRSRLAGTDIADHALEALRKSAVRKITILGRRGPAQAAFTNPELREFGRLEGVSALADPADLELDRDSRSSMEGNTRIVRNMKTLEGYVGTCAQTGERVVHFRFLVSPLEILGSEGRVTGVRIERNRLVARADGALAPEGTGKTEIIPCGMVIRSIGYRGAPLPGVPFDSGRGIVQNLDGRVSSGGAVVPGEYVVGWAKRGPSGVIGTNKADSAATVALMAQDLDAGVRIRSGRRERGLPRLLWRKRHRWVDRAGWQRLCGLEEERGKAQGRPRVKLCSVDEMLSAAGAPADWPAD